MRQALDGFLAGAFDPSGQPTAPSRRLALRPMPRWQRALAHEIAERYGFTSGAYGTEPEREPRPNLLLIEMCLAPIHWVRSVLPSLSPR